MRSSARREERGTASVELVTMLPLLLFSALIAWQLLLVGFTVTSASNAARAGSRAESLGRNGEDAAIDALSSWLRDGTTTQIEGTATTVYVEVPIIIPGLTSDAFV